MTGSHDLRAPHLVAARRSRLEGRAVVCENRERRLRRHDSMARCEIRPRRHGRLLTLPSASSPSLRQDHRTPHRSRTRSSRLLRGLVAVALLLGIGSIASLAIRAAGDGVQADEARRPLPAIERRTVGQGPAAAMIVRRRGAPPQRAVIFLHGWRLLGANAYRSWMLRLARRDLTVIAPRYQARSGTPPEDALDNALAGIRTALQQTPVRSGGVVVVGHSAGAALAVDYAAVAGQKDLPPASGVLAIYPGRIIRATSQPIPQVDLVQIPSTTRLVVMASTTDAIVGDQPARELWDAATAIPPERRRFVSVRGEDAGNHFTPALANPVAQRTFWSELDRLLEETR